MALNTNYYQKHVVFKIVVMWVIPNKEYDTYTQLDLIFLFLWTENLANATLTSEKNNAKRVCLPEEIKKLWGT